MDINMPVMDGSTTCKILRKNNFTSPIIAFTVNVLEHDVERYYQEGLIPAHQNL